MDTNIGNWQKAFWKIVSDPTVEVVATLVVVMVATWFVLQNEAAVGQESLVLFGRR